MEPKSEVNVRVVNPSDVKSIACKWFKRNKKTSM